MRLSHDSETSEDEEDEQRDRQRLAAAMPELELCDNAVSSAPKLVETTPMLDGVDLAAGTERRCGDCDCGVWVGVGVSL